MRYVTRAHPLRKTVPLGTALPADSEWIGTRHTVYNVIVTKENRKAKKRKSQVVAGRRTVNLKCIRCDREVYKIFFNDGLPVHRRKYHLSHVDQNDEKIRECYMLKMVLEGART